MAGIESNKVIRLSKSCLNDSEKQAVMGVLDREFLGMGDEVRQFEEGLSIFFGRTAICVSTGTAALHLALQASGVGLGDEVLVQSLTYVASFQAISATGATPIACEVNPTTLCIDLNNAKTKITSNTKAIMPVHYAGGVGNLDEIYTFAKENHLKVIEDAAHAFGTTYKGKKVGSFGNVSCFSFDGIKNLTSGEGGCIVTDNQEVLNKVKDARLLGVENDTEKRFSRQRSWSFNVIEQGWRYHMSNIMAAIGIEQLKKIDCIVYKRRELVFRYEDKLRGVTGIKTIVSLSEGVAPHIYVTVLDKGIDRDKVRNRLLKDGVETGIHYTPNHLHTLYKSHTELPITEELYERLLTLPLHPDLSFNDIDYIVGRVLKAIR
jgi:dTDP-4-amino-4,6-dideoxygalactose transaminase